MLKYIFSFLYLLMSCNSFGQRDMLVRDLDGDGISDTIRLDSEKSCIVCLLSAHNFTPIYSSELYLENMNGMGSSVSATKTGFYYSFDWMRAGEGYEFVYEKETERLRLVYMNSYAFGNAVGDGRQDLNIDLLTGECSGVVHYFDYEKEELIPSTIDLKIEIPPMYVENFDSGVVYELFEEASIPNE